jgi:selenide,water dikinase
MKIDIAKRRRVMERSQALGHCICDVRRPCPCDLLRNRNICPCAGERPDPADLARVKLTEMTHNAGCASKIAPADLEGVLSRLPEVNDPAVLSGLAAGDDAAIYRISENLCLVQTVDVFTPCVDDPRVFGRICAANCLSDIYAMGGEPRTALSILAFPTEKLPDELMFQLLAGAMEIFEQAGVALVGGHSIKDEEVKLGFAITGLIDPAVAAALEKPATGDVLLLTKPLGTGVLTFCQQIGRGYARGLASAQASMCALNSAAAEAMKEAGATACTDVTGFGLFVHLLRMMRQSKLTAEVFAEALPAFDGAVEAFRQGVVPGAIERNREYAGEAIHIAPDVDEALVNLGFDAQTSGGLLIAVPGGRLEQLRQSLARRRAGGFVIGRIIGSSDGRVLVTRSAPEAGREEMPRVPADRQVSLHARQLDAQQPDAAQRVPTSFKGNPDKGINIQEPENKSMNSSDSISHQDGCCAGIFNGAAAPDSVAEAQQAFGAMLRLVQGPGVLSEKTKELILFSLVVQSRCHPCFDAHYRKACDMGITQAELDEAAWCAIAMGGAPVKMFYQESLRQAQGGQKNMV